MAHLQKRIFFSQLMIIFLGNNILKDFQFFSRSTVNPVSRQFMSMSSVRKSHKRPLSLSLKHWKEVSSKKSFHWSDQADCEIAFLAIFPSPIRFCVYILNNFFYSSFRPHFCFQFHHSTGAHMLTREVFRYAMHNIKKRLRAHSNLLNFYSPFCDWKIAFRISTSNWS